MDQPSLMQWLRREQRRLKLSRQDLWHQWRRLFGDGGGRYTPGGPITRFQFATYLTEVRTIPEGFEPAVLDAACTAAAARIEELQAFISAAKAAKSTGRIP